MDILGFGCMAGIIGNYDSTSGESRIRPEPFGRKVCALRFSDDGSRLFAAVGGSVYELSTGDFQVIRNYHHPNSVRSLYLSSVDQMTYTSSGNRVMLWDLRAENQYQALVFRDNPNESLNRIDYLPSKHLLVGAQSAGYVPRWDTRTGRLLSAWNAVTLVYLNLYKK